MGAIPFPGRDGSRETAAILWMIHRNVAVVNEATEDVKVIRGICFRGIVELCNDLFKGIFSIFSVVDIFNQFLPCHLLEGAGRNGC